MRQVLMTQRLTLLRAIRPIWVLMLSPGVPGFPGELLACPWALLSVLEASLALRVMCCSRVPSLPTDDPGKVLVGPSFGDPSLALLVAASLLYTPLAALNHANHLPRSPSNLSLSLRNPTSAKIA